MRLILVVLASAAFSTGIARGAAPVCALLDPDKHPRAALLEAKLLTDPSATWVERADIEKVLKEQKLQTLFAPQGIGERVKLGKLLKADLLVTVRPVTGAGTPVLEVIVSETAGGLRLTVSAVPVTQSATADVAALVAAVRGGAARHGEKITEIVAVPPFVSNDLELTHDHLKGALAKLAEAEALGRKGVVVVELAEAEALTKEVALAAPGARLERPLPVYLLGEYRHEGRGKDRTIAIKLKAERGGKPVGSSETLALKPGAAPAAVRKWSAGVLDALAKGQARPPADPVAEAKQLADRAATAKRLGYWQEAAALAEAALLIDPSQIDLHMFVALSLADPLESIFKHELSSRTNGLQAFQRLLLLYRRGLEHLEAFIDGGGDPSLHRLHGAMSNAGFVPYFRTKVYYLKTDLVTRFVRAPEARAMLEEARAFERALFTRLLKAPKVANAPVPVHMEFVVPLLHNLPAVEQYGLIERLLADLPEAPGSEDKARWYIQSGYNAHDEVEAGERAVFGTGAAYEKFKSRVTGEKCRFAALAKAELAKAEQWHAEQKAYRPPAPPTKEARDVRLTAVKLEVQGAPDDLKRIYGLLPAGPALDVAWGGRALYLMKEKGKLVRVSMPATWEGAWANIVFDGKYVWAATKGTDPKIGCTGWLLTVTDPATGKTWDLTKADGMPEPPPQTEIQWRNSYPMTVAPLGPGRVCVAGSVGRAWVAVLTFDPAKGGTAKIVHEAREAVDRQEKDQWKKSTTAFFPGSARTLTGTTSDGKPVTRVLIGRMHSDTPELSMRPLLVDPDTGSVEVITTGRIPTFYSGGSSNNTGPVSEGKLYFQEPDSRGEQRIMRVAVPGAAVEPVVTGMPGCAMHQTDGRRLHAVEVASVPLTTGPGAQFRPVYNWWTVEPGAKQARLAGTGLPTIQSIGVSSHYGLVAVVMSDDAERDMRLFTVDVAAPPRK